MKVTISVFNKFAVGKREIGRFEEEELGDQVKTMPRDPCDGHI
jgi:hypothetical protein